MEDDVLLARFVDTTLPAEAFPHREHIRVARLYLLREPLPLALARFIEDLKRFATSKGAANKYHATITCAFMVLINERMDRFERGREESFEAFAERNADLFEKSCLLRYYSKETLASPLAKKTFVMPDLGCNDPRASA